MKQDIRRNILQDGDLVLKLIDSVNSKSRLEYGVVINESIFYMYSDTTVTTFLNTIPNQIVKIDNLTKDEEIKRQEIIDAVVASNDKRFGLDAIKTAKRLNGLLNAKSFLDIKVGDIVIVYDEYSHDYSEHRLKVNSIEFDDELINGTVNPKGMRCYGTDLDYWNEETQDYDGDDYITIVTEGNFVRIED